MKRIRPLVVVVLLLAPLAALPAAAARANILPIW